MKERRAAPCFTVRPKRSASTDDVHNLAFHVIGAIEEEMPCTATGKILHRVLRQRYNTAPPCRGQRSGPGVKGESARPPVETRAVRLKMLLFPVPQKFNTFNTFSTFTIFLPSLPASALFSASSLCASYRPSRLSQEAVQFRSWLTTRM